VSTHPYDILALPKQGSLIFTPCPGTKGVDLTTSARELHQAGAPKLIRYAGHSPSGDKARLWAFVLLAVVLSFKLPEVTTDQKEPAVV
jgi:hypothetical protein